MTKLASVSAVLAALAVGALVVAVIGLSKDSHDKASIHALEAQVRTLTAHTGGATASVTSRVGELEGKVKALEAKAVVYSRTDATVASLDNCIPELQSEFGGLEIKGETYASSYITNRTNISKSCQALLYGTER